MNSSETNDQQLADEFFNRIATGDPDAAFEMMLFFMGRLVKKDVDAPLYLLEGLARVSAAMNSEQARGYLDNEWKGMRPILRKRLAKLYG